MILQWNETSWHLFSTRRAQRIVLFFLFCFCFAVVVVVVVWFFFKDNFDHESD